ncbi:MAG: hypothetical protein QXR43_08455 [Thermofilum sp.]
MGLAIAMSRTLHVFIKLKQVSDDEIRNRINELIEKLSKAEGLNDERQKHIDKAKEILRRGW